MYLTELFGAYTPIKRYLLAYVFPLFKAVCVLWILIGLLDCLRLLWLANSISILQMLAFFFWSWILKVYIEVQKKK